MNFKFWHAFRMVNIVNVIANLKRGGVNSSTRFPKLPTNQRRVGKIVVPGAWQL